MINCCFNIICFSRFFQKEKKILLKFVWLSAKFKLCTKSLFYIKQIIMINSQCFSSQLNYQKIIHRKIILHSLITYLLTLFVILQLIIYKFIVLNFLWISKFHTWLVFLTTFTLYFHTFMQIHLASFELTTSVCAYKHIRCIKMKAFALLNYINWLMKAFVNKI